MRPSFTLPLPAGAFLASHWQKAPLLMRGAAKGLEHPEPDILAGLALEEDVESRLILGAGDGPWESREGPFTEDTFSTLPSRDWTLLVQSVDHLLTEVSLLLDDFRFLPGWRVEDIMISYAATGGSVGPHYDRYDVFLLQARGQRRWKLGPVCNAESALQPNDTLRLLADMPVEAEYVLNPGDVLYLPPWLAHWGTAEDDDCVTWSVGFRAPSPLDILARLTQELAAAGDDLALFADPDRQPPTRPERLEPEDIRALVGQASALLEGDACAAALAAMLSEPRQPAGLDFDIDCGHIAAAAPGATLVRHGAARLIIGADDNAWLNGERWPLTPATRPLATLLARQRLYSQADLDPVLCDDSAALLQAWIEAGYFAYLGG